MLAFSRRPSQYALTLREMLWWRPLRVIVGNDSIASRDLALYVAQPMRRRMIAAIMHRLFSRAALFLAPSDASKRDLVENFDVPPEQVRVFKNWTRIVPQQTGPKTIDLVYVGRVDPVKEITRLVEIVGCVRARSRAFSCRSR